MNQLRLSSGRDRSGVARTCIQGSGNTLGKDRAVKSERALGIRHLSSLARVEMECYVGVIVKKIK